MLLFGLGHRARNGKDSLGSYLAEKHGFRIYHYAGVLKQEAAEAGWSSENKNESAKSVINRASRTMSMRGHRTPIEQEIVEFVNANPAQAPKDDKVTFLQWIGTEFRRFQDPDYWVKATFKQISEECNETDCVAICDMRFVNEFLAVKQHGGYTFDVRRLVKERQVLKAGGFVGGEMSVDTIVPYIDDQRDPNHPSECELDGIPHDFTITASNLDQLYQQGENILKYIKAKKNV